MIKILKTKLLNVRLMKPDVFKDHRGTYVMTYSGEVYRKLGLDVKFVEDDYSRSKKNVLRGIHADSKAWKLISCPSGEITVVIVNANRASKNFGKWQSFEIGDKNPIQILVPPKHGVAHLVRSKSAVFLYKQSEYYDPKRQTTFVWNDPRLKIKWPVKHPILSKRDRVGHYV